MFAKCWIYLNHFNGQVLYWIQTSILYLNGFFKFISRANQYVDVYGTNYVAYRCVRYVQITENSYYYYILAGT